MTLWGCWTSWLNCPLVFTEHPGGVFISDNTLLHFLMVILNEESVQWTSYSLWFFCLGCFSAHKVTHILTIADESWARPHPAPGLPHQRAGGWGEEAGSRLQGSVWGPPGNGSEDEGGKLPAAPRLHPHPHQAGKETESEVLYSSLNRISVTTKISIFSDNLDWWKPASVSCSAQSALNI